MSKNNIKRPTLKECRRQDIAKIMESDPAATNVRTVRRTYTGYKAINAYRLANRLWEKGFKSLALYISYRTKIRTGIDIHPAAKIGVGVFIDHGVGVVIGETAEVGDGVTMFQGVTLGGTGKETGKRHPTVENGAMISAGAKILGAVTIGENSKIGAGSVVLTSIPPNSTAVGVPAKIVRKDGARVACDCDAENRIEKLEDEVAALKRQLGILLNEEQKTLNHENLQHFER